jgi:hypothetical protein
MVLISSKIALEIQYGLRDCPLAYAAALRRVLLLAVIRDYNIMYRYAHTFMYAYTNVLISLLIWIYFLYRLTYDLCFNVLYNYNIVSTHQRIMLHRDDVYFSLL